MDALFYLITSGLIYTGLFLVYFLLFRDNTNFQTNRVYLLVIIPLSFILPFINLPFSEVASYNIILPSFELGEQTVSGSTSFDWTFIITLAYLFASLSLFGVFLRNLARTIHTISRLKKGLLSEIQPFSFFSFIHVPSNLNEEDRNAIFHHESIHSSQLHSADIIIYEICKVILWWNPFLWIGLHSVKSNHEFIADKLASEKADKYSSVLVAQLLGVNCSVLANNFKSKPLIKKRIMMMKSKKSKGLSVLKYALVIPVIGFAVLTTTDKSLKANPAAITMEKGDDKVYNSVDVMPEFKGGIDALYNYLGSSIKYPEEAKKNNISGKVFVSFVIDKKGRIKETTVIKPLSPALDKEAKRVIEGMPNWKPGKNNGKKVNVKYTIPINFSLQD